MARPRKPKMPLGQGTLNNFVTGLRPSSISSARQHLLTEKIKTFRSIHERKTNEVYLGKKGDYVYYRDPEFYYYHVYNPQQPQSRRIAELTLDDEHYLTGLYVDRPYQRKGIGKQLLNFANITNMSNGRARLTISRGVLFNSRYRLTPEAIALVKHCIDVHILEHDQLIEASIPTPENSQF